MRINFNKFEIWTVCCEACVKEKGDANDLPYDSESLKETASLLTAGEANTP